MMLWAYGSGLWRELGAEERKPYEAQHEQDKERHRTEIAAISGIV